MLLKILGEIARLLPPDCGISLKDLSASIYSGSQTSMSCSPFQGTLNTCGPLLINKNTWFWPLPLLVTPREQLRGLQGGLEGPVGETLT